MSSSAFRKLLLSLYLAMAGLSSVFAQSTITVNGVNCPGATILQSLNTIAITTTSCSGGPTLTAPSFTSAAPPSGSLGVAYSFQFSASGNPTPSYAIVSGTQPTGLSLNTSTGLLSGTPTAAGSFSFAVQATNSQGSALSPAAATHSVSITTVPPVINSAAAVSTSPGANFSHTLTASQVVPSGGWAVTVGALPSWATLSATGVISGIPGSGNIGTTTFSVVATNANGASTAQSISITVSAPILPAITGTPTGSGTAGTAYSFAFGVTGTTPITWAVTGGTQPAGLTLSNAGVLSGTPTLAGTYTFTVTATNGAGSTVAPASGNFTVTIAAAPVGGVTKDTTGIDIPVPSKFAGIRPSPHSGDNGAGSLYAWAVNPARCNNTAPAISTSWHHNIDFQNHRLQGQLDYFEMNANESLTYEFIADNTGANYSGTIYVGTGTQAPLPANFINISTKPCDFDLTKLVSGPNRDWCFITGPVDTQLSYTVTSGPVYYTCKMIPGQKYYLNLRWQNGNPGGANTSDSCAAIGFGRCGGYLQIR